MGGGGCGGQKFKHLSDLSSGETRQSAAPGRQFAALYRALVSSRFLRRPFLFLFRRPLLSRTLLCSHIIFCPSGVAKLDGFMLLYNFFCPSTVVKLVISLPILSTNLQNAAPKGAVPPLAGSAGPVVTPL